VPPGFGSPPVYPGARLHCTIMAEWLGADREDDLEVSNTDFREVHAYDESTGGFERVAEEDQVWRNIRSHRIKRIGPRRVSWWKRFPSGYKLEFQIGNPDGP
jgi:hypothetical protein